MSNRRGKGEGSIFKRADGRWAAYVTLGYQQDGRQKKKWVYGRTRKEAAVKLAELLPLSASAILLDDDDYTVGEWLRRFAEFRGQEVKRKSRQHHQWCISVIDPLLGKTALKALEPLHVKLFFNELATQPMKRKKKTAGEAPPLSASSRKRVYDFFNAAMKEACALNLINQNPVGVVKAPKTTPSDVGIALSRDQVRDYLGAAERERRYALCYLLLSTGMRIGEALGLMWRDLVGARLRIERTLSIIGSDKAFETPKSVNSRREIEVANDLLRLLDQERRDQQQELQLSGSVNEHGLIFTSSSGTAILLENFRRVHERILKRAELDSLGVRIHDLRHTYITLALKSGLQAKVVADRVGDDVMTIMQVYAHVITEDRKEAAKTMQELLT